MRWGGLVGLCGGSSRRPVSVARRLAVICGRPERRWVRQVDYGTGPMVRDPDSGKYRRTRLFVLTLGCSRKCVRLLAFRTSARVWPELYEKAFRRLGGSPRVVVLDNLREGVLSPDFYDSALNQGRVATEHSPTYKRTPGFLAIATLSIRHPFDLPISSSRFTSRPLPM